MEIENLRQKKGLLQHIHMLTYAYIHYICVSAMVFCFKNCSDLQIYRQFGLFIQKNACVPEGGIEGGREATPTSISIFDSYDMKTL